MITAIYLNQLTDRSTDPANQGPYAYTLYKDQLHFPEQTCAALFTTGFLSAGLCGFFVGSLADRHGRRLACLVFCSSYGLASLLITLSDSLPILFAGRMVSGFATSLLYCAFDSWMVTEWNRRGFGAGSGVGGAGGVGGVGGESLGSMYASMSTLTGVVAIAAGIVSEWLVGATGTKRAPFVASAACLGLAFAMIWNLWTENYGDNNHDTNPASSASSAKDPEDQQQQPLQAHLLTHTARFASTLRLILRNKAVLYLGLASNLFEGTMYLFVFFWSPALEAARSTALNLLIQQNHNSAAVQFSSVYPFAPVGGYQQAQQQQQQQRPDFGIHEVFPNPISMSIPEQAAALQASRAAAMAATTATATATTAAAAAVGLDVADLPPFGLIFASFMCSMMLGSLLYNVKLSSSSSSSNSNTSDNQNRSRSASSSSSSDHSSHSNLWSSLPSQITLLSTVFALAAGSLLLTVYFPAERSTFWGFCVFELCVGLYWPCVGFLKGSLVEDGVRARVYAVMRIPLNGILVLGLVMTREGTGYREMVFVVCSGALLLASVLVRLE